MCDPKNVGGLGFKSLRKTNKALMFKSSRATNKAFMMKVGD